MPLRWTSTRGDAVIWHGNSWHGSFVRQIPGIRMNLAVYFNRQYIQTQERHGDVVPDEVRERHANDTRFLNLLGAKQPYGWRKDGPELQQVRLDATRSVRLTRSRRPG